MTKTSHVIALATLLASLALPAAAEIVVGQVVDLTGATADVGKEYSAGAKAYFEYINAQGGVGGQKIQHLVKDDGGTAPKTIQLTQELIDKDKADVLFGYTGTANVGLVARIKLLQKNNIALVAPLTGSDNLRVPHGVEEKKSEQGNYDFDESVKEGWIGQLFHVRAGYGAEARKIVKQAVSLGMKRIAVLYADDGLGKNGLRAVENALKQEKLTLASKAIFNRDNLDMAEAVKTINGSTPQAVIIIAEGNATAKFVKEYRKIDRGAQLFALSVVDFSELVKLVGNPADTQGVGISQVVPMPFVNLTPVAREHAKLMAQYSPGVPISYRTMEGFIAAKVLVEGIKHGGATREKIIKGLESLQDVDTGGYIIRFGTTERRGSNFVELTVINREGKLLR